jgi:hypothetical protein
MENIPNVKAGGDAIWSGWKKPPAASLWNAIKSESIWLNNKG